MAFVFCCYGCRSCCCLQLPFCSRCRSGGCGCDDAAVGADWLLAQRIELHPAATDVNGRARGLHFEVDALVKHGLRHMEKPETAKWPNVRRCTKAYKSPSTLARLTESLQVLRPRVTSPPSSPHA